MRNWTVNRRCCEREHRQLLPLSLLGAQPEIMLPTRTRISVGLESSVTQVGLQRIPDAGDKIGSAFHHVSPALDRVVRESELAGRNEAGIDNLWWHQVTATIVGQGLQ